MTTFPIPALAAADRRARRALLAALVLLFVLALALALAGGADARPMLDPCTYERPVCPTYAPR